MGVTLHCS